MGVGTVQVAFAHRQLTDNDASSETSRTSARTADNQAPFRLSAMSKVVTPRVEI